MDSQKLLRSLLEAALAAKLEKNELRMFLALLNQTIGYGKASDPLTMGRLAQLTGIRKDRVGKAVSGLVDRGLFERVGHPWLDFTYSIPERFFQGAVVNRFFAPSVPVNGKAPPSVGQENHSAGTYRDTPLQSSNLHKTNKAGRGSQAQQADVVCAVADAVVDKSAMPDKPVAVSPQAYQKLLPALQALSSQQASGVLQLLELSMLEGSIRTSQERMGGGLIKAARQGTLDTSRLDERQAVTQSQQEAEQVAVVRQAQEKVREQAQERAHLERLAKMANVPVSTLLGVRDE